ncbi:MAG TPA: hypothetical protein PK400_07040 [Phycisphaerales bacterium]|nr:hypothetical protein [Phycisphaerales bacterium]HRQ74580.1 hypothetical protein [Phycisphaerales bacterium]
MLVTAGFLVFLGFAADGVLMVSAFAFDFFSGADLAAGGVFLAEVLGGDFFEVGFLRGALFEADAVFLDVVCFFDVTEGLAAVFLADAFVLGREVGLATFLGVDLREDFEADLPAALVGFFLRVVFALGLVFATSTPRIVSDARWVTSYEHSPDWDKRA